MDIENTESHGQAGIEFTDRTGTPCTLWVLENIKDLRFDLDTDFSQFSQEDIKALLPYLEAYVNSGTLELHTFLPLQKLMMDWADLIANYTPYASSWGKDAWDEWHERLNRETEQALSGLSNTDDYVAQIKALQQIVKQWIEPQESPSQGDKERIAMAAVTEDPAKRIEALIELIEKANKARAYYMRQCDKQVDHIANLEELLEEWSKFASEATMIHPPYMIHQVELQKKTTQLIGEEQ